MILDTIQSIFEKLGYLSTLEPAVSSIEGPQLIVNLPEDSKNRARVLSLKHLLTISSDSNQEKKPVRVVFHSLFPFTIDEGAINDVAHLLLFLNPFLDLGAFELNEIEKEISLRYVWIFGDDNIDEASAVSIVGSFLLSLTLYSDLIESVATGQKSLNEVLSAIVETLEEELQ